MKMYWDKKDRRVGATTHTHTHTHKKREEQEEEKQEEGKRD